MIIFALNDVPIMKIELQERRRNMDKLYGKELMNSLNKFIVSNKLEDCGFDCDGSEFLFDVILRNDDEVYDRLEYYFRIQDEIYGDVRRGSSCLRSGCDRTIIHRGVLRPEEEEFEMFEDIPLEEALKLRGIEP